MSDTEIIQEFFEEETRPAILDLKAQGLLEAMVAADGEVCLYLIEG